MSCRLCSAQIGRDVEAGMMRKAETRSAAVEMAEIARNVERMHRTGIREGESGARSQLLDCAMDMVEEGAEEDDDLGIWEDDAWGHLLTLSSITEI